MGAHKTLWFILETLRYTIDAAVVDHPSFLQAACRFPDQMGRDSRFLHAAYASILGSSCIRPDKWF